jgi:hypothetical protein
MTILRPACVLTIGLGLTSACAARAPLPGPEPATVRTTIEAQIAQSARAIPEEDTMVTSLQQREALRR